MTSIHPFRRSIADLPNPDTTTPALEGVSRSGYAGAIRPLYHELSSPFRVELGAPAPG
jgi:hypothetical protein